MTWYHPNGRVYDITPVPAPRQTRSDVWKDPPRPCVGRYRAFRDECRLKKVRFDNGNLIVFNMPMPKSWPDKKKTEMRRTPHQQKPDIDNLFKALCDAVFKDDKHIYDMHAIKRWSINGFIEIFEPELEL